MSPVFSFDPAEFDFVIIRHASGMHQMEPWKMKGRLEAAMHGVVEDLFEGKFGENMELAEFALGFIAALDVLGNGRLKLRNARDRSELTEAVEKAFASMHGKVIKDPNTTVMSDACKAMLKQHRGGAAR